MKLISPEGQAAGEVGESDLSAYLAKQGLACVRSGVAGTLVVFPESVKELVQKATSGELPRVRYRGLKSFPLDLEEALDREQVVCLVAGPHLMREFFSTEGFCRLMHEVTGRVANADFALPPGSFGDHKHLAVWRRKTCHLAKEQNK